jgi:hypothetical protein
VLQALRLKVLPCLLELFCPDVQVKNVPAYFLGHTFRVATITA